MFFKHVECYSICNVCKTNIESNIDLFYRKCIAGFFSKAIFFSNTSEVNVILVWSKYFSYHFRKNCVVVTCAQKPKRWVEGANMAHCEEDLGQDPKMGKCRSKKPRVLISKEKCASCYIRQERGRPWWEVIWVKSKRLLPFKMTSMYRKFFERINGCHKNYMEMDNW